MKKYSIIGIIAVAFLVIALSACDKIEDTLTVQETPNTSDTVSKRVLLFDFTGHLCTNCPTWGLWAQDFSDANNQKLVIISVHAGWAAVPLTAPFDADFTSAMGNELQNHYNPSSNPAGVIDNVEYDGNLVVSPSNWETAISLQFAKPFTTHLELEATLDATGKVSAEVTTRNYEEPLGKYKIVTCLVGDSIGAQKNNDPEVGPIPEWEEYHQHNVLIGSMNGTWGGYVTPDNNNIMVVDETYLLDFSYTVNSSWKDQHLSVVSYIYDEATMEIIQVAETDVELE